MVFQGVVHWHIHLKWVAEFGVLGIAVGSRRLVHLKCVMLLVFQGLLRWHAPQAVALGSYSSNGSRCWYFRALQGGTCTSSGSKYLVFPGRAQNGMMPIHAVRSSYHDWLGMLRGVAGPTQQCQNLRSHWPMLVRQ
eukprot:655531-Pelagomonas_calceolata.AAC.4